ncbi:MAG: sulfur carrier protein ThiS [Elusimicrobia bacterium]|jgi:sulfur carrier protein|nr:sulfur carrier protein ThiS [Elusimicrobiota bacterium]MBR4632056.1 sulfur carrier protein ThiS [Elusimicrobiota bacterium]
MRVNGKDIALKETITLSDFLKNNNYNMGRIVIELNGKIVSKDKYNTVNLKDTDVMEVLTFVGGG